MIAQIDVIHRGVALRVRLADGGELVLRQADLADTLHQLRVSPCAFVAARVVDDSVEVEYEDGAVDRVTAAVLAGDRNPRTVDLVLEGIGLAMTCAPEAGTGPLGLIRDATICIGGGRILWIGPRAELPRTALSLTHAHHVAVGGRLVSPGLIDPHTHPLFAGNRAEEFGMRAQGADYQAIAAAGGGIAATMQPTRAASFAEHVALTRARMTRALRHGTTTCEAKSGYDLTVQGELRLLEVARFVDATHPIDLVPTLLGAHVVPPDRRDDRDGFVAEVADKLVPAAATQRLAQSVDVYCDEGAFTLAETERILRAGRNAGLAVRAHVGQFADLGGAELLASLGALSADHLEQVTRGGARALAAAGTVAVMLPGACVQLRMAPPPVELLRAEGVPLALGTDLNPGTSHSESLPLQMWLATTHYGMTVTEAWLGVTRQAARAIGRSDLGTLQSGSSADLVLWDAETPAEIPYHYGINLAHRVIKSGRIAAQ